MVIFYRRGGVPPKPYPTWFFHTRIAIIFPTALAGDDTRSTDRLLQSLQNLQFFVFAPTYTAKCRLLRDHVEPEFKASTSILPKSEPYNLTMECLPPSN